MSRLGISQAASSFIFQYLKNPKDNFQECHKKKRYVERSANANDSRFDQIELPQEHKDILYKIHDVGKIRSS
jgi:hypothetical protein